ncbi:hypothetical protein ACFVTY_01835 [Streptomyces sp. NPDC058067]|uniref:hypothetical protein n=1 Tax=Streptomyces sp. NPDC058067 TaxID=3346324 RepID=UPI0036E5BFB3
MTAPATPPDHGAAAPTSLGALSQLVQDANDSGISYQQMAERTGNTLPKQYFQKLVKAPPAKAPTPAQIEAIAGAIEKSPVRVKAAAAAQYLEYEATELAGYDEEVRIIVGHLAGKSKKDLLRWRMMIEADERAQRESE